MNATEKELKIVRDFRDLEKDYRFDPSIFNEEPERIARVKEVIDALPPADRVIILMYADCGSVRKLADKLGFSHTRIAQEVRRIKKNVIAQL